ncbi:Major pollen allergen Ole e 10 [Cardamine amara subsp. amara]|uniref:Major pollen allergen Ole e 10 n=1 Tax=Cardamine amara subsp. amara TaxID=228776 RepID=A0ABD0ZM39_CARAN
MANMTLLFILISSIMIHHLPMASSKKWCVANKAVMNIKLQANINFGCSQAGVDCKPIRPGGSCFNPDTLYTHASYVMNAYYQSHGHTDEACLFIFGSAARLTDVDPSSGGCVYVS